MAQAVLPRICRETNGKQQQGQDLIERLLSIEAQTVVTQLPLRSEYLPLSRFLLSELLLSLIVWGRRKTVYFSIWEFLLAGRFLYVSLFQLSDDDCCSKISPLKGWPQWLLLKKALRSFSDVATLRQLTWSPTLSWSGRVGGFSWLYIFSKRLHVSLLERRRRWTSLKSR